VAIIAGAQRKTFGYIRFSTHEQALCGLTREARKRKITQFAPATAPPVASKALTRSLAGLACAALETRKTEYEEEVRTQ
jgi:uncharacterized protein YfeS